MSRAFSFKRNLTCRSKGSEGEWIERAYDHVIACSSLKGKVLQMKVMEDFELRPHKAVSFEVEEKRRHRNGSSKKVTKTLLGYSGGRLSGRSAEEAR